LFSVDDEAGRPSILFARFAPFDNPAHGPALGRYNGWQEMIMHFRWIEWNLNHIEEHGVDWDEAEQVVREAKPPYPRKIGEDKWLVIGPGRGGRFLQVIYVPDPDRTIFIVHARPITEREKRRYRRKWKP
jgi:uncharacterized DUF497 family protein